MAITSDPIVRFVTYINLHYLHEQNKLTAPFREIKTLEPHGCREAYAWSAHCIASPEILHLLEKSCVATDLSWLH